jgi:integrase
MQKAITAELVKSLKPITKTQPKPYEVWDTELKGFILRVQPSGVKTYLVEYARHRRITIGQASAISAAKAREQAGKRIADYIKGDDPLEARKAARAHTLESFVADKYKEWAEAHQSSHAETLRRIASFYDAFGNKKLPEITAWMIEKHRTARLKADISAATVNRDLDALRGAFTKAIEWGVLKTHPMVTVRRTKIDELERVRYLSPEEDKRLRNGLDAREAKRRLNRDNFNQWRRERGYKTFPDCGAFTDHLKPIVILALNTGLRRGELFKLQWQSVDLIKRILTVTGKTAKSKKTRYVPLNDEAFATIQTWRKQNPAAGLVFPGPQAERMTNISTSWEGLIKSAQIKDFHFHDCRHDFASKLVMAGEDLNTVRELLGHSDIKMTLRYAHLAPDKLSAAVAKLGGTR